MSDEEPTIGDVLLAIYRIDERITALADEVHQTNARLTDVAFALIHHLGHGHA